MTMLEKMARAIFEAGIASFDDDALLKGLRYTSRQEYIDAFWDTQIPKARAALGAMLDPSQELVHEFNLAFEKNHVRRSFNAMIQAALDGK